MRVNDLEDFPDEAGHMKLLPQSMPASDFEAIVGVPWALGSMWACLVADAVQKTSQLKLNIRNLTEPQRQAMLKAVGSFVEQHGITPSPSVLLRSFS